MRTEAVNPKTCLPSRGLLCKTVLKVSDALQMPYEHLKNKLPHEKYLGIDETGQCKQYRCQDKDGKGNAITVYLQVGEK